jgi:glutamate-1-semialdehyde 2,1-aminomutase
VMRRAAEAGSSFGAPTKVELALARRITDRIPAVEMVRFVSSGTEAAMSALRLARAATGRRRIVKFEGCYHGHADPLLAAAGSGVATLGLPDSPGVPAGAVADTLLAPYNDLDAVERLFATHGPDIAAVILEPVAGNMGVVPPRAGYLEGLRLLTARHGALLVFDEVMTGWRAHPRAAQVRYGVRPDLVCLGKVLGGGLPAAAFGGRADLMRHVAPAGPMYQAGTLSGNPLAMAAGLATLDLLERPGAWDRAAAWAGRAAELLEQAAEAHGVPVVVHRVGTMFTPFFGPGPFRNYGEVRATDRSAYARFFHAMLDQGVYLPPSAFEAWFTSTAHGEAELEHFGNAVRAAFAALPDG